MISYRIFRPRYGDFNIQGVMKSSVFFDFVCEAHLENFEHRYGIDFVGYRARNTKWRIWSYEIEFLGEIERLENFKVHTRIAELEYERKKVVFRFTDLAEKEVYAIGALTYRFQDTVTKDFIQIWPDDLAKFQCVAF